MGRRKRNPSGTTSRWTIRAALVLVFALVAVACGGGGSSSESDGGGGTDEDAGPPQMGGKVVYGLEAETTDGWCLPEGQLAISGIQVARSIYDTLTTVNDEGEAVPFLAQSVEPNDDYTEWTIELREGIKFHDGSDLDAEVVKNNLDAYRGKYTGRNSVLFLFVLQDIADVTVEGPLTVKVTTSRPWVAFDSFLFSSGRMGMVAQAQLDSDACGRELVGTGPFKLVDWRVNSSMKLERNPDYWRTDADGNQLPYLDELEYQPTPEATQLQNGLDAGSVDAFHVSSNTNALIIEDLREQADSGDISMTESGDFAEAGFLMLNVTKPPFDNPIAREAAAIAVDREEQNNVLNNGIPELANGPFAEGALGYTEDSGYPEYDPDRAKDLVTQYEEETGEQLEFTISAVQDTAVLQAVEFAKQYYEDAGMTVSVTSVEQSALITTAIEKNYQGITWRNYPGQDPDNLYVWWYGAGNPVNFMGFDDPEVNELLDQGRTTTDAAERQQIYEDLNKELNKEFYQLWASWTIWAVPAASDVHGMVGARPVGEDGVSTDGSSDYPGLALGVDPALIWREQ
ncbi:MAG TPA: ABC transporter substrate-binding protein [Acidimicrobiales bacterium]|nr:ABC transporter substrate-binding protein [Acidimicrobiales bacterium]